MRMDLRDFGDVPDPPYPGPDFERIGLFFFLFSISEEWICAYLKTHGDYTNDCILEMTFRDRVKHWVMVASQAEPNNSQINYLHECLNELGSVRDALAHASWRQHEEQLQGTFTRRRDKKVITISCSGDLDVMVGKAKHCTAIMDFGEFLALPPQR